MVLPTVGWVLSHQSSTKTVPHRRGHTQSVLGNASSQETPGGTKLTIKTKNHFHVFYGKTFGMFFSSYFWVHGTLLLQSPDSSSCALLGCRVFPTVHVIGIWSLMWRYWGLRASDRRDWLTQSRDQTLMPSDLVARTSDPGLERWLSG